MLNRRSFLTIGSVLGVNLSLADYLGLRAANKVSNNATAESVIYIYLPGGFAAQETFDPKPLSPIEYRGPLGIVGTSIVGIQFSEHLKETAKIADKISVIRSMTHNESAHERGTNNMFTGWTPSLAVQYPSLGSITSHELGIRNKLPPYISIPNSPNEFANAGYLSQMYSSFSLGSNPEDPKFKVQDLNIPDFVTPERFANRRKMLDVMGDSDFMRKNNSADQIKTVNSFYENAFDLITSKTATESFDLSQEDETTKEMYGKNPAGMRLLLSRRLIEAGVRFVTVTYGGWDMHENIAGGIGGQLPALDKAFAALITDLSQRGLLNSTLVIIGTEFGRTPKINATNGRDHWPKVFSTVIAGGGIKEGLIYGASDPTCSEVETNPVSPADWAATIFHLLGIDYEKSLYAPGNRPVKISDGKHLEDLLK